MGRQTAGIQEQDTQFKGIGEHGKQEFSQKDQLSCFCSKRFTFTHGLLDIDNIAEKNN